MKKVVSTISLVLAIMMIMTCLAACGAEIASGDYNMVGISGNGTSRELRKWIDNADMTVYDDGTAVINTPSGTLNYTYDKDDRVFIDEEGATHDYIISDDFITIAYDAYDSNGRIDSSLSYKLVFQMATGE